MEDYTGIQVGVRSSWKQSQHPAMSLMRTPLTRPMLWKPWLFFLIFHFIKQRGKPAELCVSRIFVNPGQHSLSYPYFFQSGENRNSTLVITRIFWNQTHCRESQCENSTFCFIVSSIMADHCEAAYLCLAKVPWDPVLERRRTNIESEVLIHPDTHWGQASCFFWVSLEPNVKPGRKHSGKPHSASKWAPCLLLPSRRRQTSLSPATSNMRTTCSLAQLVMWPQESSTFN